MDPTIKAKWLTALRSDSFKQATGNLYDKRSGGFYYLGVLCKLPDVPAYWDENGHVFYKKERSKKALPFALSSDLGIPDTGPTLNKGGIAKVLGEDRAEELCDPLDRRDLSELNDNGATFHEIADLIEAYINGEIQNDEN